jgi:hypothetical protein
LKWIDKYTFYRTRAEILNIFGRHFAVTMIERDYVRFRIRHWLSKRRVHSPHRMAASTLASKLSQRMLQAVSGMVLLAEKPVSSGHSAERGS